MVDGSNNVSSWTDQTPSARAFTPASVDVAHAPLYVASGGPKGNPYLQWTTRGIQQLANAAFPALSQPFDIFSVTQPGTITAGKDSAILGLGTNQLHYEDTSGNWEHLIGATNLNGTAATSGSDSVVECRYNGATSALYVNNVLVNPGTLTGNVTGNGLTVGNALSFPGNSLWSWSGRTYALLICNAILSGVCHKKREEP